MTENGSPEERKVWTVSNKAASALGKALNSSGFTKTPGFGNEKLYEDKTGNQVIIGPVAPRGKGQSRIISTKGATSLVEDEIGS